MGFWLNENVFYKKNTSSLVIARDGNNAITGLTCNYNNATTGSITTSTKPTQ